MDSVKRIAEMRKNGAVMGRGIEIILYRGIETTKQSVVPFFKGDGDHFDDEGSLVKGYINSVAGDSVEIAFGWDKRSKRPLDIGRCVVYGSAIFSYHLDI